MGSSVKFLAGLATGAVAAAAIVWMLGTPRGASAEVRPAVSVGERITLRFCLHLFA